MEVIVGSIFGFFLICLIVTFSVNPVYCYLFEHKAYKRWKEVIKYADECVFTNETWLAYYFDLPKRFGDDYYAILWKDMSKGSLEDKSLDADMVSIHSRSNQCCILSCFDKMHSRKMGKILKKKITKN